MSKHQIGYITFAIFTVCYALGIVFLGWALRFYIPFFILWLALLVFGSFYIRFNYHIKAFSQLKTNDKTIALTFDDGPSEFTEKVVELLEKYNFKATFFCIGKNIEKHPEIIQKLANKGHLVANHTYTHSKIGFATTNELINEIKATDALIEQFAGKKNVFFRPPFGVTSPSISRAVKATKQQTIGWSIRSLDTAIESPKKITQRVIKKLQPGSVILLHDTSERTVLVLEQLLPYLHEKNYNSVNIKELIQLKNEVL